jgi:tetratricopeptide (TPR) repeat protein
MTSAFNSNLKHLNDCREKLDQTFDEIDGKSLLQTLSLNSSEQEDDTKPSTFPQQQRIEDGSPVLTIDCLYEAANKIQPEFKDLIEAMAKELDQDPSVELKFVPLKDRQRAETKFQARYTKRFPGPTCSWIYDVVRCSIICYTPEQIQGSIRWLQEHTKVVQMKNRFVEPAFNGYRDILLYVQVVQEDNCGGEFGHICEVQIHLTSMWEVAGHIDSYISYQSFQQLFAHCPSASVETCIQDLNQVFPLGGGTINTNALDKMCSTSCSDVARLWTLQEALVEYFGELDLAFPLLERALAIQKERQDFIGSASTWEKMAHVRLCQGDLQEALDRYHCALDVQNDALGEDHPHVGITLNHIANILAEEENADEALQYYQLALDIQQETLGMDHPETAASLLNMASMLQSQGQLAEAMHKSQRAMTIFQTYLKEDHHFILDTLVNMATVRHNQDQLEESIELYQQALDITEKSQSRGPNSVQAADIMYKMAVTERDASHQREALKLFDNSLSIYTQTYGLKHPKSESAKRQVQRLRYILEEEDRNDCQDSILSVKKRNAECGRRRCVIS